MGKLWVRYNGDDFMYEVVKGYDTVICKTNTEKEAKGIIERSK